MPSTSRVLGTRPGSEQFAKFVDSQACILDDTSHGDGIDGVVRWNGNFADAVGHDDMLTLAQNSEACLLQGPNSLGMINTGQLSHD